MSQPKPKVAIHYCNLCRWLLRASWMSQELLSTFADDLGEVALCPGEKGQFQIFVDGQLIWCRVKDGGFPEAKQLKQRVRDQLFPDRDLGHNDQ